MSSAELWLTIAAMGAVTFLTRLSMITLLGRLELPRLLRRALRYVPPAVLTAIVVPALVSPAGQPDLSPGNLRLIAGLLAAVVAWGTKSVLLTIAVGMAVLWGLQWLMT